MRIQDRTIGGDAPFVIAEAGVNHDGDVGAALRSLSPELRTVVQATVIDGLTTREAARLLGLPQGTVKTRVRAAKSQLRGRLSAVKGGV